MPPEDEFQKVLAQTMANTNPVDDLLELANDLWEFEQKYQMSSTDFYEKYQAGLLEDELQSSLEWVATHDFFKNKTGVRGGFDASRYSARTP